jgi:hypothetical protein
MNAQAQQILIAFLGICSPFLFVFLIVGILGSRYKEFSERRGWTVQPHPEDHRDYVFRGLEGAVSWEMEYYIYEHYRKLGGRYNPFTNVIVWTSNSTRLPDHTPLIHPRRARLRHIVHPRLSVENDKDLLVTHEIAKLDGFLFRLPQKTIASGWTGDLNKQHRHSDLVDSDGHAK